VTTNPSSAALESWLQLFSSSVHLDSLLYKLPPKQKSLMARILPVVLLRPHAVAGAAGVQLRSGEPWSLENEERGHWKPLERVFSWLEAKVREGKAVEALALPAGEQDFPPDWVEEWTQSWGEKKARELVRVLGAPAPMSLRVSRQISPEDLIERLDPERLPVQIGRGTVAPFAVSLSGYAQVLNSEPFQEGLFEIQDEGSQLMALFALWPELLAPMLSSEPGTSSDTQSSRAEFLAGFSLPKAPGNWKVVDACAGAGGKSLALADALRGGGRVFAYDTVPGKLQALRKRASRSGYRNIQTAPVPEKLEAQEELLGGKFARSADRVLVDAPCSGWGVARRNPDIKWRQDADERDRLARLQLRLLETYQSLVAPGGFLTFGVCTFRKEETQGVVAQFTRRFGSEFTPVAGGYLGPGPCDGFYMHAWRREK
jgi:16S rRNA (cytosine967-C5)-methyltransferase